MPASALSNLHFDKGNGALFSVQYRGAEVWCYVSQKNEFLAKKASPGQPFPDIFERYGSLVAEAAMLNIERNGISADPLGNEIESEDLNAAQRIRRERESAP